LVKLVRPCHTKGAEKDRLKSLCLFSALPFFVFLIHSIKGVENAGFYYSYPFTFDLQSAYALTDRLAVVLSGNSSNKGDPYGESGGAYFTVFAEVNKWGTFLGTSIGVAKELPDCYDVQCN